MNLAVIGDSKFEKVFDEILPKDDYFIARINNKECAFFTENCDLNVIKSIGANRVLEITNDEIDSKRASILEDMGLMYSGFSVSGKDEYIRPLIEVAISSSSALTSTGLTDREKEVLGLLGSGMTNKEIAKKLFLSEKTVKNHLNNIFKKIDVADRTNAALYAVRNGMA